MKSNFVWLSKSLFCPEKDWHTLLNDGIRRFVKDLTEMEMERYQIQLNAANGPNIRLALLTTEDRMEELNDKVDDYFAPFFDGLPKRQQGPAEDSLFTLFPANSIQYGLYDLLYMEELLDVTYKIQQGLSELIIDHIGEKCIDREARLQFAFKLHMAAIKNSILYYQDGITELLKIYQLNPLFKMDREIESKNIENGISLSSEMLTGEQIGETANLSYLRPWMSMCEKQIQKELERNVTFNYPLKDRVRSVHAGLGFLIDKHMGIGAGEKRILYHFIEQALKADIYRSDYALNKKDIRDKLDHFQNVNRTKNIYRRLDNSLIGHQMDEIRLFVIARNESLRLPFFLEYYSKLGVDRVFLLDNDSSDNTREIALGRKNVHVFKIDEGYRDHWYWMEYFLEKYGNGYWCMVVDVDELFHFPFSENLSVKDLATYLDNNKYTAIRSVLLDVYSDKPIWDTVVKQNDNPLDMCNFFDNHFTTQMACFLDKKKWKQFYQLCHFGGVRQRVFAFSNEKKYEFCLTKISLFKYSAGVYLTQGMHSINGAEIADIEGAVIHTKFLRDFIEKANVEWIRQEHYRNGEEYKIYNDYIMNDKDLVLKYEHSVKFRDTEQLIEMGIMKSSEKFGRFISQNQEAPGVARGVAGKQI